MKTKVIVFVWDPKHLSKSRLWCVHLKKYNILIKFSGLQKIIGLLTESLKGVKRKNLFTWLPPVPKMGINLYYCRFIQYLFLTFEMAPWNFFMRPGQVFGLDYTPTRNPPLFVLYWKPL